MFLHSELGKAGIILNFEFVCTLLLSKRLYPSLENKKLATLAKYHGIKFQGKGHRALADAKVTAELFIQITNDLKKLFSVSEISPQKLLMWQKQPISKFIQNSHQTIESHSAVPVKVYFPPITAARSSATKSLATQYISAEMASSVQEPRKEVWIKTKSTVVPGKDNIEGMTIITESGEFIIWDENEKRERVIRDFTEVGYKTIHETYPFVASRLRTSK
jgi:DNA polymerase III alpha subunit (gram-positive type)